MSEPVKEIIIPHSHIDAFLAHGPGRGQWWATQFGDFGVTRNDRVRIVLQGQVPRYMGILNALILHVESPKDSDACDRLGIPTDFIGWSVIFYDGKFPEPVAEYGADGQCDYVAQGRRLRGTTPESERRDTANRLAGYRPPVIDNSPAAQRAVVESLRGGSSPSLLCNDAAPCRRCVRIVERWNRKGDIQKAA